LEYLPAYSPDLNPIEEAFSKIKAFICCYHDYFFTSNSIIFDMYEAMSIVMMSDAAGYFIHAEYF
ncbi:hypothetical protein BDR04DRAFT_1033388, partial [Suillus decipiens]